MERLVTRAELCHQFAYMASEWWAQHPGRWDQRIEDALASGNPRRVGLAWAAVLLGATKRGLNTRLAEITKEEPQNVSKYLNGKLDVPDRVIQALARELRMLPSSFWTGLHPFSLTPSGPSLDPENPAWEVAWDAASYHLGGMRARELRQRFPDAFRDSR